MQQSYHIVIIGAGAAGYFCALNVAQLLPHASIVILEASNQVLSKVRISGGGRCNVTHNCNSIAQMSACYPRGEKHVRTLFKHFFVPDTLAWFAQRGVDIVAEADGRMFPKANTSEAIINCFLQEAQKFNITLQLQSKVTAIQKNNELFTVTTSKQKYTCKHLVVACGGFSKPSMFDFITSLGHSIQTPVPSLFTFNLVDKSITQLMGLVAPNVSVTIQGFKQKAEGPLLITHWGFSGPAVLKLSAFAARYLNEKEYRYTVIVNWCAHYNETSMLTFLRTYRDEHARTTVSNAKPVELPQRLWLYLLQQSGILETTKWGDLSAKQQNTLARMLCNSTYQAQGKTTYKDEFVTSGGITLAEIDSTTCESKIIPQLYFAGEILDCDGITGGFNFQHAWSSAMAVAQAMGNKEIQQAI